jgi:hypothetical protein
VKGVSKDVQASLVHTGVLITRSIWEIPAWEKGGFFHYEHSHFGTIPSFSREFFHFSHTQEGIVPRGNAVNPPCVFITFAHTDS